MPSAASRLVRIGRAARSAAATTSRFAQFVEAATLSTKAVATKPHAILGSDRAASVDLRMNQSTVHAPPRAMAPASLTLSHPEEQRQEGKVKFVVEEKDLESEAALWALYERWCKDFNQKRDHDEMVHWFNTFKETVLLVHRRNNANLPYKLGINKFADGKLRKLCCCHDPILKKIDEEFGDKPGEFILGDGDKLLKRVFADYKVVHGRLYVHLPKGVDVETITTNPEWVELEATTNPPYRYPTYI
ncbi:hypothetical protein CFC21_087273 [Triticum aestivum]|uniref:Cathepsin propeptide inhibitor domain-containing protein n=4 Tax=Triticum TaxID=4564 RepID=A0A1D6B2F7_WHEAT|nr:uncharacterized protein LOC123136231 [Triticum aestivum]KAF7083487.1 hypothetical protein CFC21_087271 [Triticum aestivum]KAF7083489.1 hypothetical protein CFC21_087273 [Triticum aestivum]VAI55171.1 unnamed protein product [Triticum turgidum subsp. durum]